MSVKFINIEGIKLAYQEQNEDQSKTIFFIHGNSSSSRVWNRQLTLKELSNFRLIAIDLPAHGQSKGSEIPDELYSPKNTGKIIAAAVRNIAGKSRFIIVGFSYGTIILAEMLLHGIMPDGIVLLGPCIVGKNHGMERIFLQDEYAGASPMFNDETSEDTIVSFFKKYLIIYDQADLDLFRDDYFQVKRPFRSAMIKSAMEGGLSDEVSLIQNQAIPICIIFGTDDNMVNIHYLDDVPFKLWRNTIHLISGSGHFASVNQPDEFNKLLVEYASDRFK